MAIAKRKTEDCHLVTDQTSAIIPARGSSTDPNGGRKRELMAREHSPKN